MRESRIFSALQNSLVVDTCSICVFCLVFLFSKCCLYDFIVLRYRLSTTLGRNMSIILMAFGSLCWRCKDNCCIWQTHGLQRESVIIEQFVGKNMRSSASIAAFDSFLIMHKFSQHCLKGHSSLRGLKVWRSEGECILVDDWVIIPF